MDLTTTKEVPTSIESFLGDDHRTAKVLSYTIHKYSSYSALYAPENILYNKPSDHQSRWSSETSHSPQFLILRLERPAIVSHITFGKHSRSHYCNLKKFKIYGGLEETPTIQLLEGGLTNDSTPETFPLRHSVADKLIPCRYIKIIPIQSWAASFNFSIWFVELRGQDDYRLVKESIVWYNTFRQREALKLVLKHLRQNNYIDLFNQLQQQTKVSLEDELLSRLNRSLVMNADYDESERIIDEAAQRGLFSEYVKSQEFETRWTAPSKSSYPPSGVGHHDPHLDIPSDSITTAPQESCVSNNLPREQSSQSSKYMHLNNFWELRLVKISEDKLRLLCKRLIRQLKFKEMISVDVSSAIKYLQEELCKSYDLSTEQERKEFHSLALALFQVDDFDNSNNDGEPIVCDAKFLERSKVFDKLVSYFPESMTQPKTNLVDLIYL